MSAENHGVVPGWQAKLDRDDLEEHRAPATPMPLFARWFEDALAADLIEPTAMTLATANGRGRPSARTVLLKGFGDDGFRFYTNYDSRKGQQLADNPHAALMLWWDRLERQVRVEGRVDRLAASQSDAYFASRPAGSRVGAHASPQSHVISGRSELEQRFAAAHDRFDAADIPRPDNWGGYLLAADMIEFWQGRKNRLHDRLRYTRTDTGWQRDRLAP